LATSASKNSGRDAVSVLTTWLARPRRAVIFDFNGTLSDDEPILLEIFTNQCRTRLGHDLDPADYYRRLAGRSDREIIEVLVRERVGDDPLLVEDLLIDRRNQYLRIVSERSPITSAPRALVIELGTRGVPVGIVTGAQRPDVSAVLAGSGLADVIRVIVCEEDVEHGKPDPEGYLKGAELLGATPSDVLVFEDSIAGIQAAKAAGMKCLGVPGTRTAAELATAADGIVDGLSTELLAH
jgi:beta-phosphoglucomutase